MTKQCFQGSQSCPNPVTKYSFDETGQTLSTKDPAGNTITYSYADSYSSGTPPGNTNAFMTKVTHPATNGVNHIENFSYAYSTGELTLSTNQNGLQTKYLYNDPLDRLTETDLPDSGQTTISYNDAGPSPSVTTSKKVNTSPLYVTSTAVLDGLGHAVQTQLTTDPDGSDFTDTTYDGMGHVWKQSNPHRAASLPTDGTTTYFYDALGRTCLVAPPDGTLPTGNTCPTTQPSNDLFTTYAGKCTTVTDQAGKARKSCADGLGRLTSVFEDPGGLNYETDYAYDALNNLLTVNQKGGSTISSNWRTRTFTYNSLSQLLTAANPESGTITYTYDANANLLTKKDARNITATYAYDALDRLTQKSFSDTTPLVKYGYDALAPTGCTPPTLTITNGVGRRTSMCDAAGSEAWSYDAMGRVATEKRTTNNVSKTIPYTYNLDGSVATLTYPSGRVITYTPGTAGRPLEAKDLTNSINYALNAKYAPQGTLASAQNGGGLYSTYLYNNRLQPCRVSVKFSGAAPAACTDAATGNILDFKYDFGLGVADNGNVAAITNNRDTTRSQSFTYDTLNRIATAKTASTTGTKCWDEQFGYDPWGNLLTIGRITGYTCSNEELLNASATQQNRISGDTYDTAGNLTAIPSIATYTYNAENQLVTTAGVTYTYDGDGKRVQKSSGTLYWYGAGSDALDETDLAGVTTNAAFKEYVFFGGKRIARRDSTNAVNYYFADHLAHIIRER